MEQEIKTALDTLLAAIPARQGLVIATEMAKLDDLAARGRNTIHPQLRHFLEQRSYAKAAQFLGGASDIPTGKCGGKASP
jgi:hypothetical protein